MCGQALLWVWVGGISIQSKGVSFEHGYAEERISAGG